MNPNILEACTAGSFAGTMKFPEVIDQLMGSVEWYSANLLCKVTTHYAASGDHHQTQWPALELPDVAQAFDGDRVLGAIRAIQHGKISYREFLREITAAGVTYYTVHLQGRKAMYFGRHGDFHVEHFPGSD